MNEFDLIEKYFRPLATHEGALSLADDAALVNVPAGKQLVITKDAIAEGVHYVGNESPVLIAKKLLRTNLSDLAAKGAVPLGYLLMVALPKTVNEEFIKSFAQGLKEDQELFGISLLGGDTISTTGSPVFSLTALGLVDKGKMLKRSGAKIGDKIFVSGTIGDAALGLKIATSFPEFSPSKIIGESTTVDGPIVSPSLFRKEGRNSGHDDFLLNRYQLPQPRLALGQKLIGIASACMDVSDGLVQDLGHLCKASGVGAKISTAKIPLSDAAKQSGARLEDLITGGDDYELLFTVPTEKLSELAALCETITEIGEVVSGGGVQALKADGSIMQFTHTGYSHFSS